MRSFLAPILVLVAGSLLLAGLYWSLLNVPESNVMALILSAILCVLIVVVAGLSAGAAIALASGQPMAAALRRAVRVLPGFVAGLVVFAGLWWLTGRASEWWAMHRGEVDAVFLRYPGITRTGGLHFTVSWLLWTVRWVVGASIVLGLVSAAALGRPLRSGLRTASRAVPFGALLAAALIVVAGLWRIVYWRPDSLPPTGAEMAFVSVKLALLYAIAIVLAAVVIRVYARTTMKTA